MTYTDWQEPTQQLRAITGPPTKELLSLTNSLEFSHKHEPHGVLSALVEDWLRPVLHQQQSAPATEKQLNYLKTLTRSDANPNMTRPIASAWINHHLALRTIHALNQLKLKSGDKVQVKKESVNPETGEIVDIGGMFTISSIGANGLVYFRGGNGNCAWPDKIHKADDS